MERWRPVVGYEGLYEISDSGRLKRIGRDRLGRSRYIGHILSPSLVTGYCHCLLSGPSGPKNVFVHVLVAEAFIGPKPAGMQVNHKNGNKADPRLENLEYVTRSENHLHALKNGLFKPPSGDRHWYARLSNEQIREIVRRSEMGVTNAALAKEFRCSTASVSRYKNGLGRAASCQ